ncbi:MAG: flagellar biosynthesis anti-sigma factor FlgM [Planctomycetia bacterium]|nr:flagellar biosynthesis anti-sigma factor FlgM [Planctomycetia bacterium]
MQVRGPLHVHAPQPLTPPHAPAPALAPAAQPAAQAPSAPARQPDELALSDVGQLVARVQEMPEIRAEKVAEIRAQLAAGAYDVDGKLETALNRLLDELE